MALYHKNDKDDVVIKNCSYLKPDFAIAKGKNIHIKNGRIRAIVDTGEDIPPGVEIIHGDGKLVIPGLVDAHTHVAQQFLKGRILDEFPMVWARILVPYESHLTAEDVYWSTKLACLEMIKSGTTAFAESGGPFMERAVMAILESGLRAVVTRSTMDMGAFVPENMRQSVEDNLKLTESLYRQYNNLGEGRIKIWFGLRSLLTCSRELIKETAVAARSLATGVHMHFTEHRDEVSYCLENYKKRPTEYLQSLGLLGPNLLTAHNVVLAENELELLKEYEVKVVHCPRSNLGNHGFPKTPRMLQMGISVGLGSDGAAASSLCLFDEIRVFRSAMHAFWGLPYFDPVVMPAKVLLKMATAGGANALLIGEETGSIEVGKKADLALVDIDQPHLQPTYNLINTIVEAATSKDISDVIIDGEVVMKERQVLTMDEEAIMFESKKRFGELAKRAGLQ
ncbi:amidohydrolase [Neomoorella thermoacetica]|uniref:amidohydrolase n=1 Tax=Neomoorella thermoacetica TaxID=1525 RepID=UPI0008FAF395|nr:amidohydrolase [Moorella thermoacetica]APC07566.1 atrazine chlorohydrolase [Moorella thermoacetica]OIQ53801.1 atrazine chlorohydrolase [Moorella thermoacetica]